MDQQCFHDRVGAINIADALVRIDLYDKLPPSPPDAPQQEVRYTFARRLVLPVNTFLEMYALMGDAISKMQEAGLLQSQERG